MAITRSGFVTLIGRPNVGKSSLLNTIVGSKISIVSNKVQTTRTQIRGILTEDHSQMIFVDTPGIHKPLNEFGQKLNDEAYDATIGIDLTCFVLDARQPFGSGDARIIEKLDPNKTVVVVNKIDIASPLQVFEQLDTVSKKFPACDFFPVSARTNKGVAALVQWLQSHLPEGPFYYPPEMKNDISESHWVAELVREQLFHVTEQELPHSITTQVTEWEWPRVRVEILVERPSQKAMVIGKGGVVLKKVGSSVRAQCPPGMFLELFVKVEKKWKSRPGILESD